MKTLILAISFILIFSSVFPVTAPSERQQAWEKCTAMQRESFFKNLHWRETGPYFMSGRIVDIEVYENDPYSFIMAAASGGLWKTDNNATTWTSLFDHEASITIGDIAISQKDKNLLWVGTGEANASRSSYAGSGVYKALTTAKPGGIWACKTATISAAS
jgi:hypothetical protein